MSSQPLARHIVEKCINYNISDGFIHIGKPECRLGGHAGGLKAGGDIRRRRYGVYSFREDSHATSQPTSPSAATKNSGVDLTGLPCKGTRCFVTGMFERYPLNRTTKADLAASLDEAINMVRETDTRDTG